ncbi:MAG: SRPBCC domain-containing protein [Dehalococcoidales bacterium]|nr:SRPBCC domain-containing protein [Dehalococcoidales bacterium]
MFSPSGGGDWLEGHYSVAAFLLEETEGATNLTFTQTGVPEEYYDDIYQGWYDHYWSPMKELLETQPGGSWSPRGKAPGGETPGR